MAFIVGGAGGSCLTLSRPAASSAARTSRASSGDV